MMTRFAHRHWMLLLFCWLPTSARADVTHPRVVSVLDPGTAPGTFAHTVDQFQQAESPSLTAPAAPSSPPQWAQHNRFNILTRVLSEVIPLGRATDEIDQDKQRWNPSGRRLPQTGASAAPSPGLSTKTGLSAKSGARSPRDGAVFAHTQHGPFDDLILAAARQWQLDPFLLKGLLANESRLDPWSVGKKRYGKRKGRRIIISGGASGIAQFTQAGIRAVNALRQRRWRRGDLALRFSGSQALVPQEAVSAAAELLAHLTQRFGRDGGVTAYNSGIPSGLAVSRMGFWGARQAGKLNYVGIYPVQGHRFLINVLRKANQYRLRAGLAALAVPEPLPTAVARRTEPKKKPEQQPKTSAAPEPKPSSLTVAAR